ncbi:uncharacterized protein B0I36DRAFT_351282 [Microdochium trichocladiopsis]|uniref:Uncharacterized protein n=1 Tax=Microdochium trichocladiopsis TaxID=1682393 RepID=A0A9P8Y294_9PEZI|nr:uncharacterized protein B0I36DRAFT_351282 [Microdochium trichocladiopsis]KAH7027796.1 hypothetical protein B0I36DRAFT_351282 [Microdochium trichocladiopsis]
MRQARMARGVVVTGACPEARRSGTLHKGFGDVAGPRLGCLAAAPIQAHMLAARFLQHSAPPSALQRLFLAPGLHVVQAGVRKSSLGMLRVHIPSYVVQASSRGVLCLLVWDDLLSTPRPLAPIVRFPNTLGVDHGKKSYDRAVEAAYSV